MPRIIAGSARGILLETPEGMDTRPTSDSRKEAVFSSIQFELPGAVFLDLFSGSGAAGLEAVSRGAAEAVLVESGRKACAAIRRNIAKTRLDGVTLMETDVYAALDMLAGQGRHFDVIFLDPPYRSGHEERVLNEIVRRDLLAPGGRVVVECASDDPIEIPQGLEVERTKTYRVTRFILLRNSKEN